MMPSFVGLNTPQAPVEKPAAVLRHPELPADFDWRAYLDYNTDVKQFGEFPEVAVEHFTGYGYKEARVYKRIPVLLRYTACGGLMNQHYSHLAAVTLAAALGADLIIPHAVRRDSFSKYFNVDPTKSTIRWSLVPFDTLWDAEYISTVLKGQGIDVYLAPSNVSMPDLRYPQTAFQHYPITQFPDLQRSLRGDMYLASRDLSMMLRLIKRDIVSASGQAAKRTSKLEREFPPVLLDLPCTLFSVKIANQPIATQVARHFRFSPRVVELAEMVLAGVTRHGSREFNGLHLRIEEDATDWKAVFGGNGTYWQLYLDQCKAAGFTGDTPVYAATGIVSYQGKTKMAELADVFKPYAQLMYFKEQFLSPEDLKTLHPEQLALVDFIVLTRSSRFVGLGASTFSVFIREFRYIHNISPRATSSLIDSTIVGTEPLFKRSAIFA